MTTPAIKAAQAKLKSRQATRDAAEKALEAAKKEVSLANDNLRAARMERDKSMPSAIIRKSSRYSEKHEDVQVCIVKRTAKAVFVREIGEDDEVGKQFRLGKHGSDWWPYPASRDFFGVSEKLILKD